MKTEIVFSVNRKRTDIDQEPEIVECHIFRDESYAEKLIDDDDDRVYDRFCYMVPGIVQAIHGIECGRDWFFEVSPRRA